MGGWSYWLKVAGIGVMVTVFLFIAVGPTAYDFRQMLTIIFDFLARIAWPLAAVAIVFFLRKPLSDLIRRGTWNIEDEIRPSKPADQAGLASESSDSPSSKF
jgi:hypothetical protein